LGRAYWYAWTMMAVTGAVEAGFSLWAADVLRTHAGMSQGAAAQSISAIVAGMFLGRAAGARIALRIPPIPLYLAALATSTVGFVLFWTSGNAMIAVTGLLVLGLGNAMHYPIAIALAMQAAPDQPDRAAASASYSMGLSFGAGPLVLAALADAVGVRAAFLLVPLLLAFAAALAWMLRRALAPVVPVAELALATEG
jgi:fucose permease